MAFPRVPKLHPFDLVLVLFWTGLLLIHLAFFGRLAGGHRPPALFPAADIAAILVVLGVAALTARLSFRHQTLTRIPMAIATVFGGFWVVGESIHLVNPNDMEPYLLVFDRLLWGATFGEWIEPYQRHFVTDFLQLCYASYYFLPLVLFILLYAQHKDREARILLTSIVAAFLSNFLMYILVPARSPYVIAHDPATAHLVSFAGPLAGSELTHWLRASIESAEFNMRDCFPSGHTYISLVTLISVWRYQRKIFPIYAVIVSGLIFGTLYLRYHYVIDLAAGVLCAGLVTRWVPRWCDRWNHR